MSKVNIVLFQDGKNIDSIGYSLDQLNHMQDVKMTLAKRLIDDNRNEKKINNVKDVYFSVHGINSENVEIRYSFTYNLSALNKIEIINRMNACVLSVKREVSI